MRRLARLPRALAALLLAALCAAALASPVSAESSVDFWPPADAVVVDEFRPPPDRYSAGNRGVDYATSPGQPVHAAADGVVTFAGQVGGALHVVVLHADGVRTSYSYLGSAAVRRGQRLRRGAVVGTAGPGPLHFGARVGEEYVDPLALLSEVRPRARLLPDDGRGLPSEAAERSALQRLVGTVGRLGRTPIRLIDWAGRRGLPGLFGLPPGDVLRLVVHLARTLPDADLAGLVGTVLTTAGSIHPGMAMAVALGQYLLRRGPCTPGSRPPPRPATGRRIAVLVAGLGSSSEPDAAIDRLKTSSLGYAPGDVVRFSYRGGSSDASSYRSADTQVDPAHSGRRLRDLLDQLARTHPGVPIDVFAHSLGGLVARSALTETRPGPAPPVQHLITFGTPHGGADLATVADAASNSPLGILAAKTRPLGLDPTRPVVDALSPGSDFVRSLNRTPLPATVKATSIATRLDVVVPSPRSWLKGATNVVVSSQGLNAHGALPGSPEAQREAALALAHLPPTCEPLLDAALDAATAGAVQLTEAALAVGSAGGAGLLDRTTWAPPIG